MAKVGFIGTVETPESCHASALYHPRAADTIVRTRRWSWWRENPKILVDCSSRREQLYGEIREKKTRFEIPRILAKYRRLAMHVKEMQPSVSVLDATDRERTQRIVASFIINLFKSLSESAQDFDSQQPFTRSPPFAPPLIRCARQGQAAAAARRLCAHVALVRSLT